MFARILLLSLLGFFMTLVALPAGVSFADGDITSSGYILSLDTMDPLGGSHNNISQYSGRGALNFVIMQITNLLLFIIPLVAGVSLLIAGYYYILSGGDSEKATKAKTIIKWNIIALLVAFLSYAIINIIAYLLS